MEISKDFNTYQSIPSLDASKEADRQKMIGELGRIKAKLNIVFLELCDLNSQGDVPEIEYLANLIASTFDKGRSNYTHHNTIQDVVNELSKKEIW